MSNRRESGNRELRMVETRYGSAGEWTREGEQKGPWTEYVRRRRLSVRKCRLMYVSDEWALLASSRVAPQELLAPVPANDCGDRSIYFACLKNSRA